MEDKNPPPSPRSKSPRSDGSPGTKDNANAGNSMPGIPSPPRFCDFLTPPSTVQSSLAAVPPPLSASVPSGSGNSQLPPRSSLLCTPGIQPPPGFFLRPSSTNESSPAAVPPPHSAGAPSGARNPQLRPSSGYIRPRTLHRHLDGNLISTNVLQSDLLLLPRFFLAPPSATLVPCTPRFCYLPQMRPFANLPYGSTNSQLRPSWAGSAMLGDSRSEPLRSGGSGGAGRGVIYAPVVLPGDKMPNYTSLPGITLPRAVLPPSSSVVETSAAVPPPPSVVETSSTAVPPPHSAAVPSSSGNLQLRPSSDYFRPRTLHRHLDGNLMSTNVLQPGLQPPPGFFLAPPSATLLQTPQFYYRPQMRPFVNLPYGSANSQFRPSWARSAMGDSKSKPPRSGGSGGAGRGVIYTPVVLPGEKSTKGRRLGENNQDGDKMPTHTSQPGITIPLQVAFPTQPSVVEPSSAAVPTPPSVVESSSAAVPPPPSAHSVTSSSGNSQSHPSWAQEFVKSAVANFTPYVLILDPGEDLIDTILACSEGCDDQGIFVLSASGAVTNVTTIVTSGIVTHKGCFEILTLSGPNMTTEDLGPRSRPRSLSVALAGPHGQVFGGVAGSLVAASRVQIILGSFNIPHIVSSDDST